MRQMRWSTECAHNVFEDSDFDRQCCQTERFGSRRSLLKLQSVDQVVWIPENGHALGNRDSILKELHAFRRQLNSYKRESGQIAARPS